jgi:hypothetical protein
LNDKFHSSCADNEWQKPWAVNVRNFQLLSSPTTRLQFYRPVKIDYCGKTSWKNCSFSQISLVVTAVPLLLQSLCYCSPSATAVPLLLQSLCYCSPSATAVPLLLQSLCYCSPSATAVPLLLQSLCYCSPSAMENHTLILIWKG